MNKVLVVAFDGLDRKLIRDFDLENIFQEEFGSIDVRTDVSSVVTSELFASFITGKTYEEHGVKGLNKWTNSKIDKFEESVSGIKFFDKFYGLRKAIFESINKLNALKRKHRKIDLCSDSLFEHIDNSRAMFVPAYNPSILWGCDSGFKPLRYNYNLKQTANFWDNREYRFRKNKLFKELDSEFTPTRDFLMCHFHKPDIYHHLYGDKNVGIVDEDKLKSMYDEIDKLAKEIKEKALESGYDTVIFMSDHGLPAEKEHNENAFYSCNHELFPDREPHITDFHDKILELINS